MITLMNPKLGYFVEVDCGTYWESEGVVLFDETPKIGDTFRLQSDGKLCRVKYVTHDGIVRAEFKHDK